MYPDEPLRLCSHMCRIPHYENCPDCLGFGLYRRAPGSEPAPVMAAEAHGEPQLGSHHPTPPNLEPCSTCGSTIKGLPEIALCSCGARAAVTRPKGWTKTYVRCTACGNCERGAYTTATAAIDAWNRCKPFSSTKTVAGSEGQSRKSL